MLGGRVEVLIAHGLQPKLVLEKREDPLVFPDFPVLGRFGHPLSEQLRFAPLVLLLMQLFEVEKRVLVAGIESDDLGKGLERPIDEASALEVEAQTQQHVGMFELRQTRSTEQGLVDLNRFADLPLLAVEVAQNQMDLERVTVKTGRSGELLDGEIEVIRDQEVEAENIVG